MRVSLDGRRAAPDRRMVAGKVVVSSVLVLTGLGTGTAAATAAPRALSATPVVAAPSAFQGAPLTKAGPASKKAPAAKTKKKAPTASKSKAEVKADWLAFFSAKTPAARRIKLLQNGQQFASVIRQASKNPLASTLSASVAKVTLTSKTKADVTYSLVTGGKPVLSHQKGTSVYQAGTWKVGDSSFCSLLALEAGGKKAALPKACHTGQ